MISDKIRPRHLERKQCLLRSPSSTHSIRHAIGCKPSPTSQYNRYTVLTLTPYLRRNSTWFLVV